MSYEDNGRTEAEEHQRKYGGTLYESPSGWGVKDTYVPGSKKKGSIIPILRFGPTAGGGPANPVTTFYGQPAANAKGYWDRVGADLSKLPTQLVQHIIVDPAKALADGAGDIAKEAADDASDAAKDTLWDLAKGLALPLAMALGTVVVVLVVSSKTGTTKAVAGAVGGRR